MKPNLKLLNAVSLEFSTNVVLTTEQVKKIREASFPDSDGDSVFFDYYKDHRSFAIVYGTKSKVRKHYKIEFGFRKWDESKFDGDLPKIEKLVEVLSSVKDKLNFECTVLFIFDKKLKPTSIIRLPMKYIEALDMPFDIVQGLHLVKQTKNKLEYEAFLDVPNRGAISENLLFSYTSVFNTSLPGDILNYAKSISNRLVFLGIENV